ncbi:glycosyltransferase family 15 protein [Sphaerobolus stellatus SS14]|uniref:Glycosyltransferase family 15 protein n=1 Tax=Sphaerobolus stellatus (strain SS14) TaxID=990650 RepID=A0A0C9U084_SPHS4|nr:glycosyltransferase family 15 protein [Sphaerobolus stellatus SS14]
MEWIEGGMLRGQRCCAHDLKTSIVSRNITAAVYSTPPPCPPSAVSSSATSVSTVSTVSSLPPVKEPEKALAGNGKSEDWTRLQFCNNWEISHRSVWESNLYTTYFDHLEKAGDFFYERWGDAPVHSYACISGKYLLRTSATLAPQHQHRHLHPQWCLHHLLCTAPLLRAPRHRMGPVDAAREAAGTPTLHPLPHSRPSYALPDGASGPHVCWGLHGSVGHYDMWAPLEKPLPLAHLPPLPHSHAPPTRFLWAPTTSEKPRLHTPPAHFPYPAPAHSWKPLIATAATGLPLGMLRFLCDTWTPPEKLSPPAHTIRTPYPTPAPPMRSQVPVAYSTTCISPWLLAIECDP